MARPHIEFVQSQVIPFAEGMPGGIRPDVHCRTLSQDDETGALSAVVRYRPGWSLEASQILGVDEEIFVLEGSLEINGQSYGKHYYGHLPAGYVRQHMSCASGAVVLSFFSGAPCSITASECDRRRLVEHLDTRALGGNTGKREHMRSGTWDPSGTIHKTLFVDPDTGERTWLIGMMPYWSSNKAEVHPVAEEEFAILGDICFPMGVMRAGGYFWRPAGIPHGPFASWGGALHLCRCKGGAFATEWVATDGPNWNPIYEPILPPTYMAYVKSHAGLDVEPNY
ncbi:MAG: DUF4437 domain-containing protein [Rhodospirillaceae bacterium]|nr:DUF4437 domain-containing protein [Rhodospirillaceae bacterium]